MNMWTSRVQSFFCPDLSDLVEVHSVEEKKPVKRWSMSRNDRVTDEQMVGAEVTNHVVAPAMDDSLTTKVYRIAHIRLLGYIPTARVLMRKTTFEAGERTEEYFIAEYPWRIFRHLKGAKQVVENLGEGLFGEIDNLCSMIEEMSGLMGWQSTRERMLYCKSTSDEEASWALRIIQEGQQMC